AWIFRKLPWSKPAWVNPVHRWSGRLAFLLTLPVAYHCIFKLAFQDPSPRVLAHSLFGCAVYGAFAAKVTIVRLHNFPRFVLPVAGGPLFALVGGRWSTRCVRPAAGAVRSAVLVGVGWTSAVCPYGQNTPAAATTSSPIPANAHAAAG